MYKKTLLATSLAAILATGCATTPDSDDRVERLRAEYNTVASIAEAERYAPVKLKEAEESLERLERMVNNNAKPEDVNHQIYLTQKKLRTAEYTARMKEADRYIADAENKRNNLIIDARTREAQQARADALAMSQQAQLAAERARLAEERASEAEAYANRMATRAQSLENEVQNLSTQQTERGLVLTLGNILFEFDQAVIKPGSARTLERVAEFLNEYPDRKVMIEGFTDNTGSDGYNEDLSDRRARAVKSKLVSSGVAAERVNTRGYGEQHPVASNDSEAGRLQNRRVEIVIADQGEEVSEREN